MGIFPFIHQHRRAPATFFMGFDSTCLPEKVRRLMRPEDRASLGPAARTNDEGVAAEDAKSERELQKQILGYLRTRDIEVCCPSMIKRSTIKLGWPDMTFCYRGVPFVFEVKTPIGKLSPEQEAMIPALVRNGWNHFVIRSVEQAKQAIELGLREEHFEL